MVFKIFFTVKGVKKFELFSRRGFKTRAEAMNFMNAFKRRNKKVVKSTSARFVIRSSVVKKKARRKTKRRAKRTVKRRVKRRKTKRRK